VTRQIVDPRPMGRRMEVARPISQPL